jgi:hypothetical protein
VAELSETDRWKLGRFADRLTDAPCPPADDGDVAVIPHLVPRVCFAIALQ